MPYEANRNVSSQVPLGKGFSLLRASWVLLSILIFDSHSALAGDTFPTLVTDDELSRIYGEGLYFRVDLSLEVLTASDTPPQVVVNTGTPILIPTDATGSFSGAGGSVSLSGSAQSNVSSLVNVIGAASVINVGVNVVSITNSSSDTIYTTNINTGAQGTGFNVNVPLMP
jgi:hypothetical protein